MAEGSGVQVGAAYVSLEARTANLEAGLAAAQQRMDEFASRTTAQTARVDGGFATLGKGIKRTIAPITQLIGAVGAAIGAFTLFINIGERLGRVLAGVDKAGKTAADNAADAIERANKFRQEKIAQNVRTPEQRRALAAQGEFRPVLDELDAEEDRLIASTRRARHNDRILGVIGRPGRDKLRQENAQRLQEVRRARVQLFQQQGVETQNALRGNSIKAANFSGGEDAVRVLQRIEQQQRSMEMQMRRANAD